MKSFYLSVIVILTSTILTAQIREIPIIGNPILENIRQEKILNSELPDITDNLALRGTCPNIDPDAHYLFPGDSLLIELDTFNQQSYELINTAAAIGTIQYDTVTALFTAGSTTGAVTDTIRILKQVVQSGEIDTSYLTYPIIVKRKNENRILPIEMLVPDERIEVCAEPLSVLPGNIDCSCFHTCSETYGGNGLQSLWFSSQDSSENCINYTATRFSGRDTVCIVVCDDFTVCDTFLQPFLIVGDTLNLPFFEDFSTTDIFPDSEKWLEDLTFVNKNMPYHPPSIGAATFDGLNKFGVPYDGGYGTGDRLTSKAFDLSGESTSSKVVMSFYYQLKGRGFLPRVQDSLIVDFWTADQKWETVWAVPGSIFIALDSFPEFKFAAIELNKPEYFHDGFQFRFRNMSERTGAYGNWHVDYVILDKDRDAINQNVRDIAFSEAPGSVLKRYTAMPVEQFSGFENKEVIENINAVFFNHFNTPTNPGTTDCIFSENTSGSSWDGFTLSDATNYPPKQIFLSEERAIPTTTRDNIIKDLETLASSRSELLPSLNYEFFFSQAPEALINDTVSSVTNISSYYAYDDGTAERALEINGFNTKIAVEFEANKEDLLKGVQIYFPRVNGDISDQTFDLSVWTGGDRPQGSPIYVQRFVKPKQPTYIGGFATYPILDPTIFTNPPPADLTIPSGKFFIGITQTSTSGSAFAIGYDKNNPDAVENLWYSNSTEWEKYGTLIDFKGAPMIRPVFGNDDVVSVKSTPSAQTMVQLYPNPADDILNFKSLTTNSSDFDLQIFNALGQVIHQDILVSQLNISDYMPGIYFAKITDRKTGQVQNLQFFKQE